MKNSQSNIWIVFANFSKVQIRIFVLQNRVAWVVVLPAAVVMDHSLDEVLAPVLQNILMEIEKDPNFLKTELGNQGKLYLLFFLYWSGSLWTLQRLDELEVKVNFGHPSPSPRSVYSLQCAGFFFNTKSLILLQTIFNLGLNWESSGSLKTFNAVSPVPNGSAWIAFLGQLSYQTTTCHTFTLLL